MSRVASRRPPRPLRHNVVLEGKRACPWCGELARGPDGRPHRRRTWHPECVEEYRVASFSADAVRAVVRRDGHACRSCGQQKAKIEIKRYGVYRPGRLGIPDQDGPACAVGFVPLPDLEADHIVPLWSVDRSRPWAEIRRFWSVDNLQGLCRACHAVKTAREAGERARAKRQRRQPDLFGAGPSASFAVAPA